MAKAKSPIPVGFHSVTPQLTLDNAAEAIDWYKKGFGAEEVGRAIGPDGKIMRQLDEAFQAAGLLPRASTRKRVRRATPRKRSKR